MILSGKQINNEVSNGRIIIDPFNPDFLNPNSYNYSLGTTIKVAPDYEIDASKQQNWPSIEISESGFLLQPHKLYLGHTAEMIGSEHFVISLIGRSSMGRLGLYLQISADLSQLGAVHSWTLEMTVIQPLRVYPGMRVGQVSFWIPEGDRIYYSGLHGEALKPLEGRLSSYFEEKVSNDSYWTTNNERAE